MTRNETGSWPVRDRKPWKKSGKSQNYPKSPLYYVRNVLKAIGNAGFRLGVLHVRSFSCTLFGGRFLCSQRSSVGVNHFAGFLPKTYRKSRIFLIFERLYRSRSLPSGVRWWSTAYQVKVLGLIRSFLATMMILTVRKRIPRCLQVGENEQNYIIFGLHSPTIALCVPTL